MQGGKISKRANEIFALHVGLNVIKYYMMYDLTYNLLLPVDVQEQLKSYLKENFNMECPNLEDNICDTQEYEINLLNALHWTHHECKLVNKECYHYDIWAYAKIFYHLELYNIPRLKSMYDEYMESHNLKKQES